ncbi:MAG: chorismate synthase [Oscillospiraceae bacterium]|nr:chorismate synthase [Oscillospiraceae bacterium]
MKNTIGNSVTVTLFGESHGPCVGVVIDGLAPGIPVDRALIEKMLSRRRPAGGVSTARQEADAFTIESGVFDGYTTGTPVCIRIPNTDVRSGDYNRSLARPSHADYTARQKYHGFEDYRGGGHFSGRLTAALVAAGALVMPALKAKGIRIGTHICRCGGIQDRGFCDLEKDLDSLEQLGFAVLDSDAGEKMAQAILKAKAEGDSLGGVMETVITGLEAGLGEPWFDSAESVLSHMLFSVPAVKGVEFGAGFAIADMTGWSANDAFYMENGKVKTLTNRAGGINGGITNGMPVVFRCAVRPTPTISKEQNTVDMDKLENSVLAAKGRHDPCIAPRVAAVIDAVTALTVCDLLAQRHGTDWLAGK